MSNGISGDTNDPYNHPQMIASDNASHGYPNNHQHQMYNASTNAQPHSNQTATAVNVPKVTKPRKKRKGAEMNNSFEEEVPTKARKRKSK